MKRDVEGFLKRKDRPLPPRVADRTGQQFGDLTILGYLGTCSGPVRDYHVWRCQCVCGQQVARHPGIY